MGLVSIQTVEAQTNLIRSMLYDDHKSDREVMKELNIKSFTFYQYKKRIQDEDSKIWDIVHVDSSKFHTTQLVNDLEGCRDFCLKIVNDDKQSAKDRMDAYKTACEAKANIVKLLQEGPTFNTSLDYEQIETIKAKAITSTDEFSLDLEDNTDSSSTEIDDTAIAKINRETA